MRIRVPHGVLTVLDRHHATDVLGCPGPAHVGPDVGGEVAARSGQQGCGERLGYRQCPHGVGVRLLLIGDREHPLVDARGDEVGGDEGGGAPDRPCGVHPEHRLADRTKSRCQVDLGHHVALEHVRGLADHDGVDVRPGQVGVGQRHLGRLTDESGDGHVVPLGLVVGLPHSDDCTAFCHHSPSKTHTRFCWRHGPDVA